MPKIDHDTKQKILAAAEKVFHRNGFKGTRTTMIAEEAGISRTMLHYYFNTKEALFQAVLTNTLGAVLAHLKRLIGEPLGLESTIGHLVEVISDVLEEKPDLPSFIVNMVNESPDLLLMLPTMEQDNLPSLLNDLLEAGKRSGEVCEHITGEDLLLNIYGICAMPYLGAAYIRLKEHRGEEEMRQFYRLRRAKNLAFILRGIKP